jgi:hypothetical protein
MQPRFRLTQSCEVRLPHVRKHRVSGNVWPGLVLTRVVVTWFVTCFPVLPAQAEVGNNYSHVQSAGIGGVASPFSWSPVARCADPSTAIRRADAFAFALSQKGAEDGTFWSAKASDYLRGYFHGAALMGTDLRTVAACDIRL